MIRRLEERTSPRPLVRAGVADDEGARVLSVKGAIFEGQRRLKQASRSSRNRDLRAGEIQPRCRRPGLVRPHKISGHMQLQLVPPKGQRGRPTAIHHSLRPILAGSRDPAKSPPKREHLSRGSISAPGRTHTPVPRLSRATHTVNPRALALW